MQESSTNYPYNSSPVACQHTAKKGRGRSLQTAPSRKPGATSSGFLCTTHGCSDSLLISHVISDAGVTDGVDGRGCNQRHDDDTCDPGIPALRIAQCGNPGRRHGRVDAEATGKQTQQRSEVEHPVRSKPDTRQGLVVLVANDDDIDELEDHRDTDRKSVV